MSAQRANVIRKLEEAIVTIGLVLISPLIVSFIVYMVASAMGSATTTVGYGLSGVAQNGITCFWRGTISAAVCGGGAGLPTQLLNLINDILIAIAWIVGLVLGAIRLAPSLLELTSE